MELAISCANCDSHWLHTHLAFTVPERGGEEEHTGHRSVSLALPTTPCVECGAMQWRLSLLKPGEDIGENLAASQRNQAFLKYAGLERGAWFGIEKQTARGSAVAPSGGLAWTEQSGEDNNAW